MSPCARNMSGVLDTYCAPVSTWVRAVRPRAVDMRPPAPRALSHTVRRRLGAASASSEAVTAEVMPPPTSSTRAQLMAAVTCHV